MQKGLPAVSHSLRRTDLNANVKIALITLALVVVWFLSGAMSNGGEEPVTTEQAVVAERAKVRVLWSEAQQYSRQVLARGRTAPNREVVLKAEVSGRVIAVPVAKGQAVAEGEVICELAREDRSQRVVEAEAAVAQADIDYQGALKLKQKGYQSESAIAQAKARLESAKATLEQTRINLANTQIVAPFAGFVDDRPVEVGDYMDRTNVCAELVEIDPLKVVARLSEREVIKVSVGSRAQVELATGQRVEGEVIYLSHLADPQTRTYEMEISLPNPDFRLRAGVASQVQVAADHVLAHRVPAALLALGDSGEAGIKIVDEHDRVQFVELKLVGDDGQGIWVTGLPPKVRIITVGQ
ncbi:MAG: efflux RND transporter periplasmic adaptor subunit, partial [Gammaproteobacteria bacterium]